MTSPASRKKEDLLAWAQGVLCEAGIPSAKLDAELLLCFALWGKSGMQGGREKLLLYKEALSAKKEALFYEIVERRARHEPLAYIIGGKIWNNLWFRVTPDTLIPRDETEVLLSNIVSHPRDYPVEHVLDMGTGSGVLAIELARHFASARVMGSDISTPALKVAQHNAAQYTADISWVESDLLTHPALHTHHDIIVANLPYVPEKMKLGPELAFEPSRALFAGEDGLACIRALHQQMHIYPVTFRELWLEFLPTQYEAVQEIFSSYTLTPYTDVGGDIFFALVQA